ncbi:hypothetical protein LCGC14_3165470, partial [marine sediment metagenome]
MDELKPEEKQVLEKLEEVIGKTIPRRTLSNSVIFGVEIFGGSIIGLGLMSAILYTKSSA